MSEEVYVRAAVKGDIVEKFAILFWIRSAAEEFRYIMCLETNVTIPSSQATVIVVLFKTHRVSPVSQTFDLSSPSTWS